MSDATKPVRAGEELDLDKLRPWLAAHLPQLALSGYAFAGGLAGDVTVEQFPAGHSNLTYLLRIGDAEVVLRRPPFGSEVTSAHDMGREFALQSALQGHFPVARALAYEADASVLGAPFYLMERVVGVIARKKLGVEADAATYRRLSEGLVSAGVRKGCRTASSA